MLRYFASIAGLLLIGLSTSVVTAAEPIFLPIQIDAPKHDPPNSYWYGPFPEVASAVDMNGDGRLDIVCAQDWYEAPDWKKHRGFRDGFFFFGKGISFSAEVVMDVNRDGHPDLVTSEGRAGGVFWFANPGKVGEKWPRHLASATQPLEGVQGGDIDGDGDTDILVNHWAASHRRGNRNDKTGVYWLESIDREPWFEEHTVGFDGEKHGAALGDVNGEGRMDILTVHGWYEQPATEAKSRLWTFHAAYEIPFAASHPFIATDIDEDGDCDIIAGNAHAAGLFWWEQTQDPQGKRTFQRHAIDEQGNHWHTMTMADVNADGKKDLVTGNKLFPHFGKDDGAFHPRGVYWYDLKGGRFEKHVLAYNHVAWWPGEDNTSPPPNDVISVSFKIDVVDLDADGDQDIVLAGKTGLYWLKNISDNPSVKHHLEWPPAERGYYFD
jgi:hypothetical protein